jgi:hypothetical protein
VCIAGLLWLVGGLAMAQSLPVVVTASGNDASIVIGAPVNPLAEVRLAFQDASNLSPASLGVSVSQVGTSNPALLARLPDLNLNTISNAFALLVTIEPPPGGGLSFRDTGRLEVHTHALTYAPGSSYRLFKAPVNGDFRDVTDEIAPGSVRARTTYGGFSQFLIVADLRPTSEVIDEKLAWLRSRVATLPAGEQPAFTAQLDSIEAALAQDGFASAIATIDALRARAEARSGSFLGNEWRATHDTDNQAGELVAGAATLRFSVAYLRDFGQ